MFLARGLQPLHLVFMRWGDLRLPPTSKLALACPASRSVHRSECPGGATYPPPSRSPPPGFVEPLHLPPLIFHVSIRVTGGTIRFHFRKCFCLSSPNGLETPKRSADESASSVHPKEAAWPATEYLSRGSPKKTHKARGGRKRSSGDRIVQTTETAVRPIVRLVISP